MRIMGIVLIFGILCISGRASAYFDTGNELYSACINIHSRAQCVATVVGYFDMLVAQGYSCGPEERITKRQIVDIVVNQLEVDPASRSQPAARIAFRAIVNGFRCIPPR